MKKITLLFTLLFFVSGAAFAQTLSWAGSSGSVSPYKAGLGVAHDDSGNVYYTGYYQGTLDFDPGPGVYDLTSTGADASAYILKLDSFGHFVWARSMDNDPSAGSGGCQGYCITVDRTGNIIVGGLFYGTVDLDPGAGVYLQSSSALTTSSGFILKLSQAGNFIWAKQIYGSDAWVVSMHIDNRNNILATGHFTGTTDFDPGTGVYNLTSPGGENIYVLKLDASGGFKWAKRMGNGGNSYGYGVATDAADNVITTGCFVDTVDFDPGAGVYKLFTSDFYSQVFVSKLDSSGNFVWARQMGNHSGDDLAYGIAVDKAGYVYTTGYYHGTADFDPGSATYNLTGGTTTKSMFISKLDNTGKFVWAKQFSSELGECFGQAIAVDSFSNVYTTGYFTDSIDFDPGPSRYTLWTDIFYTGNIFISRLDKSGNFGWAMQAGSDNLDMGEGISCSDNGSVYVTGILNGPADFDPSAGVYTVGSSATIYENFYATYHSCPAPVPGVTIAASAGLTINMGQTDTLTAAVTGGTGAATWQWYVNGVLVAGATSAVYITDSLIDNDSLTCIVSTTSLCSLEPFTVSNHVVVHVLSGVGNVQNNLASIKLYPNPNNGSFQVSAALPSGSQWAVVNVLDALGRELYTNKLQVQKDKIDTLIQLPAGLPDGVYLLEVRVETGRIYSQVALQR